MRNILLSSLIVLAACSSDEERAERACNSRAEAYVYSHSHVERRLKLPDSAEFPWLDDSEVGVASHGECRHTVYAYVTSENSFGGRVRTKYMANMEFSKETGRWSVNDLQFY